MKDIKYIWLLLFVPFFQLQSAEKEWKFDLSHSQIKFSIRHMLISSVTGNFKEFDGKITTNGDNLDNAYIEFTADVNSIDTQNEKRDKHLKSEDFFNAEKFPQMKFKSKSMKKIGKGKYKLTGDLTIRDITKTVTLTASLKGIINDGFGNTRAGFNIKGKINRFDFGLKWNMTIESGQLVAGKDVDIICDVELIKQKEI